MDLQRGDVAVVTGAANGIGRALAERFGAAGLGVVLADREVEAAEQAAKALREDGADAIAVDVDVADRDAVLLLRDRALEHFGHVDVLCNNAGVGDVGPLTQPIDLPRWQRGLDVNLYGMLHGIEAFLPAMRERDRGHVVNTASRQGVLSTSTMGPYATSKAAAVSVTEMLALELQAQGSKVGVSALCPGGVDTRMLRTNEEPAFAELQARLIAAAVQPADVARLVHEAIEGNVFWIFTHSETVERLETRHQRMLTDIARLDLPR
jgi:NAD(P)-dependent dehydrogenase (short-subunit alcohol dehydrogenase family)